MSEASAAVLSAHKNTSLVTREQLAALPEVIGTDSFKPVAHIELIKTLEQELNNRDIQIVREQFAMSKDGMRLFGTLDLTLNGVEGMAAALGFRTANNRTMALQGIAGMRVFVCDNMAFSGETIIMKRRHTSGLNLLDEIVYALDQYDSHYKRLKTEISRLQTYGINDDNAKMLIYQIFAAKLMPVRYFNAVDEMYFEKYVESDEPRHVAFRERTAWNLLNAFTDVAQAMPLTTRMDATQEIGGVFGKLVK